MLLIIYLFIYWRSAHLRIYVYNQMAEWLKYDYLELVVAQFKFPSRSSVEEVNSKATYDMAYLEAEMWNSDLQHESRCTALNSTAMLLC